MSGAGYLAFDTGWDAYKTDHSLPRPTNNHTITRTVLQIPRRLSISRKMENDGLKKD